MSSPLKIPIIRKKGVSLYSEFVENGIMKTKKRQKLCYNCEGEVDLDVIVCPFCAADLREEKPEQLLSSFHQEGSFTNVDTQQSLYPPPYAPRVREDQESEPAPLINTSFNEEEPKNAVGPTILLTLGAQLLLLGLFLLFFSSKGVLVLKWDARLWYFYVLASIPLFIFGTKSINKL
jgi:hypothetical protein